MRLILIHGRSLVALAISLGLVVALGCAGEEKIQPASGSAAASAQPAPQAPANGYDYSINQDDQPIGTNWTYIWTGAKPTTFRENPKFTELVKQGKLPPVEQRLPHPEDIAVYPPPDEIGIYGGDIRIMSAGSRFYPLLKFNGHRGQCMLSDLHLLGEIRPMACKAYAMSEDGTTHTFTLRRGHKWSDGAPFTMDDVRFAWEEINLNQELNPRPPKNVRDTITGEMAKFTVHDDQNFSITFDSPNAGFVESLGNAGSGCGTWCFYTPRHYYAKWWYPTGDKDAIEIQMVREGFDHWRKLWEDVHNQRFTVGIPMLGHAYMCEMSERQATICANPYYKGVDPEGNQLPYWDSQTMFMLESREVAVFRTMAGETDIPSPWLTRLQEVPLYAYPENMERGDYSIYQWMETGGADMNMMVNQDYNSDPEIGRLLRTKDFRVALQLGINRSEINEVLYLGFGTPQAHVPHYTTEYYPGDEVQRRYTEYDPDRSREILKGLGLVDTDGDGRVERIGDLTGREHYLELFLEVRDDALPHMELIAPMWEKIGVHTEFKENRRYYDGIYQNKTYFGMRAMNKQQNPWYWHIIFPYRIQDQLSSKMGAWLETRGEVGVDPNSQDAEYLPLAPKGCYPMDPDCVWQKMQNMWMQGKAYSRYDPRRIELGKQLFDLSSEYLPNLATTAFSGAVAIKRNNVRNVVKRKLGSIGYYDMLYSFEDGKDNVNNPGNKSRRFKSENYFIPQ